MIGPGHTQTQWMRLLVSTLLDVGVEHFVVSPGSRSTPLVAALQAAGAQLHLCIDERAAGFLALGIARVTGRPAALVCTSGTAGAHYYPSVIEAAQSELPVLVLTADRPPELQQNSSPQTVNQHYLFGSYPRAFFDLGAPEHRTPALRGLRRKVIQAVSLTSSPHPGPVHLNVPAYKPLEPEEPNTDAERLHAELVRQLREGPLAFVHPGVAGPSPMVVNAVAEAWKSAKRPVLLCGPSPLGLRFDAVAKFAEQTRWPVLSEVTHPLRQTLAKSPQLCTSFELLARVRPAHLTPDLVVNIGGAATSSAWQQWVIDEGGPRLHAVAPHAFSDPLNRVELMVQCDVEALFEALSGRLPPVSDSWTHVWQQANDVARAVTRECFSGQQACGAELPFTESEVLARVERHLSEGDAVILGNSLPIRVAETFFSNGTGYRCLSQRGTNGIDGLIAGAVGTALVHPGRTLLFLGDVSALHDIGSLQLMANAKPNLIVCILDNQGGRIFEGLPVADVVPDMSPWTTPHAHDLGAVAGAFGIAARTISTRRELDHALDSLPGSGPMVWVCRVAPHGAKVVYDALLSRLRGELGL